MKKHKRLIMLLVLTALVISALCVPAFAITEAEVEAEVAASGRASVAGNVLIWFLCAVAFLKVSQKIDSFMAVLGVNVGHTGGSMLSEAMIAMRAVTMVIGGRHGSGAGYTGTAAGSSTGRPGAAGAAGFFHGGLAGMISRGISNSAVKTATTRTSAVHTTQNQVHQTAAATAAPQAASDTHTNSEAHTGGSSIHTENSTPVGAPPQEGVILTGERQHTRAHTEHTSHRVQTAASTRPTLGGMVFSHSLAGGGSFANSVIGTVARGEVAGSITGDIAAQSMSSYMGYAGGESRNAPSYSDVEIGRGRITGVETAAGSAEGQAFAMYYAEQYTAPSGEYSKVISADGTQWYKQYAQDAVERKPYMAPDDTVAYHERIIKKLPDPPKRKDRV